MGSEHVSKNCKWMKTFKISAVEKALLINLTYCLEGCIIEINDNFLVLNYLIKNLFLKFVLLELLYVGISPFFYHRS